MFVCMICVLQTKIYYFPKYFQSVSNVIFKQLAHRTDFIVKINASFATLVDSVTTHAKNDNGKDHNSDNNCNTNNEQFVDVR